MIISHDSMRLCVLEMLIRGKRKAVIQSTDDDGFPENLAPAKQKMVKRGETTSYFIWVKYKSLKSANTF